MIERMLLYVDAAPGAPRTSAWALELARALSCRVFAVAVIDRPRGRSAGAAEAEEQAWKRLYEIEDDAFQQGVRVSLLLEQGDPLQRVLHLSASYAVDIVVAGADSRLPAPELVKQSTRPVLFVKQAKEV